MIPPCEACQHGCINWSLMQAQPQSSMGLSGSFPSKRQCRRDLCQGLVVHLWLRGLNLESGNEAHPSGKKSAGSSVSTSSTNTRRKGVMGVGTPDVSWSSASSSSTSAVFQVGMLFKFFDQWRNITSNRFVLNIVCGHHLQLQSHPPLFCNFWQFNVKVATTHDPIIDKEVDELLAKGAIGPSSGGAVSILACLLFLSILVASGPYLT